MSIILVYVDLSQFTGLILVGKTETQLADLSSVFVEEY